MENIDIEIIWLLSLMLILFLAYLIHLFNNTIFSVLLLIFIYVLVGILIMSHGLDFFALTLILIYVGAVIVLFVFAMMFLGYPAEMKISQKKKHFEFLFAWFLAVGVFSFIAFCPVSNDSSNVKILAWEKNNFVYKGNTTNEIVKIDDIYGLGNLLFENYCFLIFLIGLILYSVMLGAISLILNEEDLKDKKQQ